jgi:hypothetical protein
MRKAFAQLTRKPVTTWLNSQRAALNVAGRVNAATAFSGNAVTGSPQKMQQGAFICAA